MRAILAIHPLGPGAVPLADLDAELKVELCAVYLTDLEALLLAAGVAVSVTILRELGLVRLRMCWCMLRDSISPDWPPYLCHQGRHFLSIADVDAVSMAAN